MVPSAPIPHSLLPAHQFPDRVIDHTPSIPSASIEQYGVRQRFEVAFG